MATQTSRPDPTAQSRDTPIRSHSTEGNDRDRRSPDGIAVLKSIALKQATESAPHHRDRPTHGLVTGPPTRPSTHVWPSRLRQLPRSVNPQWILPGILVAQVCLSLRLIWRNTAFNDEALYLWSGHLELEHLLHGTSAPMFQTYFSGAPVIYPVLGAIADSYAGLAGARLLSLIFMLGATCLLWASTKKLFGPRAGLTAASLFAVLGPVQFLEAFATYDAMALFLMALAASLTICARGRISEPLLVLAGVSLALADATKYATALWNPVILALAILTATRHGWIRASARGIRLAIYTALPLLIALRLAGHSYLAGILFTTLARQAGTVPTGAVIRNSMYWIGIVLVISLPGIVIADNARLRALFLVLAGAVILAPLEQARIHTETSLDKHVAFGAWFGAIAAGFVLAQAIEVSKYWKWRIAAATSALVLLTGLVQAEGFYSEWPNASAAVTTLRPLVKNSKVLAEQGAVVDFYLHLPADQLTNTFGFSYWNAKTREEIRGTPAYVEAVHQHYFPIVEIDFSFSARMARDKQIAEAVQDTPGYHLVAKIPWRSRFGRESFMIWQYEARSKQ